MLFTNQLGSFDLFYWYEEPYIVNVLARIKRYIDGTIILLFAEWRVDDNFRQRKGTGKAVQKVAAKLFGQLFLSIVSWINWLQPFKEI